MNGLHGGSGGGRARGWSAKVYHSKRSFNNAYGRRGRMQSRSIGTQEKKTFSPHSAASSPANADCCRLPLSLVLTFGCVVLLF